MRKTFAILMVGLIAASTHNPVRGQPVAAGNPETQARQFIERLHAGKYDEAVTGFDAAMTAAMPADKLQDTWQSLSPASGAFQEIVSVTMVRQGKFDIAVVTCRFEKDQLDVKVVYDGAGKVTGLWFSPTTPPPSPPPPYADPKSFSEEEVTVGSGWWALPGTLTLPVGKGPFPAVVLVHGSGPNDRDETLGPNKPFRDLAWGLASRGIAVLRYEKRTRHHQLKLALVINSLTVKEETIDDALAAVAVLRATKTIDAKRIFVLGHSLGGMLIPRIASAGDHPAGFIILAGTSRPFEDIILDQMSYILALDDGLSADDRHTLDKLREQVARVKSADLSRETPASQLPLGVPPSYWLDLRGYEPAQLATRIEKPLLVVQAGRDYQVTMDDYALWQRALSAKPNVTFRLYPKCNHLFIEGEGKCAPAEYSKPGHVAKSVVDDLAGWIQQHRGVAGKCDLDTVSQTPGGGCFLGQRGDGIERPQSRRRPRPRVGGVPAFSRGVEDCSNRPGNCDSQGRFSA